MKSRASGIGSVSSKYSAETDVNPWRREEGGGEKDSKEKRGRGRGEDRNEGGRETEK